MEYVKFRYFGTIIYVNIIEISDLGGHIEDRFLRFDPHVTAKNEMVK